MTTPDIKFQNSDLAAEINESLVANINHALRTPLNGVVGMMGLLAKTGLDKNQLKYAHIIRESTENLMLQLDNILELAKIEDGEVVVKKGSYRLKDLIKEALQPIIVSAVKKEIPISLEYDFDLPEIIQTDAHKLRLILTNLFFCALKLADRGKIVLKVSKEALDVKGDKQAKLRFTLINSKILYDALHGSIEDFQDSKGADLREFGEITVSLLTTQKLLNALGAHISFDHLKEGHEPPFHFDLDYSEATAALSETHYSLLSGKNALVFQKDFLEKSSLTQSLSLWDIDIRTVNDADKIMEEISEAYREGRPIDFLFISNDIDGRFLATLREKVNHIILVMAEPSFNKALISEFSAHLIPPIYPDELLSTLSSLYLDIDKEQEKSLSQDASNLIGNEEYEAIPARVMLVEDDATSRLYATELLEGFGCKVIVAENGNQALFQVFKTPKFDAILMDCMMPVMDGYKATQTIRDAGYTDIPIIALTANTLEKDREKCLSAGMDDYITKPVREQDLYKTLTKHIKKAKK